MSVCCVKLGSGVWCLFCRIFLSTCYVSYFFPYGLLSLVYGVLSLLYGVLTLVCVVLFLVSGELSLVS